jgi:hypothetical protein
MLTALSPGQSLSNTMKRRFTGVNQRQGQLKIQVAEDKFIYRQGSPEDQVDFGCRQIHAFAMRNWPDMPKEPEIEDLPLQSRQIPQKTGYRGYYQGLKCNAKRPQIIIFISLNSIVDYIWQIYTACTTRRQWLEGKTHARGRGSGPIRAELEREYFQSETQRIQHNATWKYLLPPYYDDSQCVQESSLLYQSTMGSDEELETKDSVKATRQSHREYRRGRVDQQRWLHSNASLQIWSTTEVVEQSILG